MSLATTKTSRIQEIDTLLLAHPRGLTQAEIARQLNVNRSTITRYLPDIPPHIYIDEEDHSKWKIDRQAYLVNVKFNLDEALAIHLATRLFTTRMDRQNPFAATAMRKLAMALESLAPQICRHMQQSADSIDEYSRFQDPAYLETVRKLTLAWAGQMKTRIWHRSDRTGLVSEYVFCPYFIEPYAIGQTTMLIGLCDPPGEMRTLKIERIDQVELTHDSYEIPPMFNPSVLLADAWGIWYTDGEPVEVVLRFSPRVARRVKETSWHRSQVIEDQADGSLIWRARIAEPLEMVPWIRGWGSDVEVLCPESIRESVVEEARKMVEVYTGMNKGKRDISDG